MSSRRKKLTAPRFEPRQTIMDSRDLVQWSGQTRTRYGTMDRSNFEPITHGCFNYGTLDEDDDDCMS